MTATMIHLRRPDRSIGYTASMGATYRSEPELKDLDLVKEARKDAVEDKAGTADEVATWTAEIVRPTPCIKTASFD